MHQSFVTTGPPATPTGRVGDSQAKVWGNYIFNALQYSRGNDGVLTLVSLPKEIFYCKERGNEQSFDLQFAPWGWGF